MKLLGQKSLSWGIKKVLDVLWYLLIVWMGLFALAMGALLVARGEMGPLTNIGVSGPVYFEMEPETGEASSPHIKHAYIKEGAGELEYKGWWPAAMGITTVSLLLLGGLALFALRELRFLFQTFVDSKPFASTNFRHLRRIASGVLWFNIVRIAYENVMSSLFVNEFTFEGMNLVAKADVSWSGLFSIGMIYILSEIFRVGATLEEEKALTV